MDLLVKWLFFPYLLIMQFTWRTGQPWFPSLAILISCAIATANEASLVVKIYNGVHVRCVVLVGNGGQVGGCGRVGERFVHMYVARAIGEVALHLNAGRNAASDVQRVRTHAHTTYRHTMFDSVCIEHNSLHKHACVCALLLGICVNACACVRACACDCERLFLRARALVEPFFAELLS